MSLVRYAADHVAALFVTVVSILAVQLVLRGAGMGDSVLAFVTVILVASALARLLVSYFARRSFWRSVGRHIVREGPEGREAAGPLSMPDLVEEPHFLEGRLAWEAFDALAQDFRSRIDAVRSEGADYRTFVEAWVHEVKTPIAAARLMADNNPGALSSAMLRELGRIDGYVEQALYYARSGSLDRDYVVRELPLSQVVRDALRTHARSLIDRGVSVSAQGLDLVVFSDAKWVAFILGQLVENAAKYRAPMEGPGARGAVLTLRATRHDVGRASEHVVLEVEDNGMGIPAADLPRVFDKGFVGERGRSRSSSRSTGIGLFLVKRLCDKMGLHVSIASECGSWTRVSISFPTNRMHYVDQISS